jgi:ferritin-like metal-binding protein YciE
MPVKDPKELYVLMLSDLRQGAERSNKIFQELSEIAQDPEVAEALRARVFVSGNTLNTIDECFKMIGQKPVKVPGRLHDAITEDFQRELAEIQSPEAKRLFIVAKAIRLAHFRIGEYVTLIAAADITGHPGVGALLESCLADKLAFVERARRLIRAKVQQRLAA